MLINGWTKEERETLVTKRCLICEKLLKTSFPKNDQDDDVSPLCDPVDDAIQCKESGNWGSTVLDCQELIHFCICDVCLTKAADRGLIYSTRRSHWESDDDDSDSVQFFKVHENARIRSDDQLDRAIGVIG